MPAIELARQTINPDDKGNIRLRNNLRQVAKFKKSDWVFAFSTKQKQDTDNIEAERACGLLRRAGEMYGI